MKALQGFLRPEFINRVDEIVHFNRLTEDNFKGIARIMLDRAPGFPGGEGGTTFELRRRPGGLPDPQVLLPDLWRPEPAPPHPAGAGGRHRNPDHRQLRPSLCPSFGLRPRMAQFNFTPARSPQGEAPRLRARSLFRCRVGTQRWKIGIRKKLCKYSNGGIKLWKVLKTNECEQYVN